MVYLVRTSKWLHNVLKTPKIVVTAVSYETISSRQIEKHFVLLQSADELSAGPI